MGAAAQVGGVGGGRAFGRRGRLGVCWRQRTRLGRRGRIGVGGDAGARVSGEGRCVGWAGGRREGRIKGGRRRIGCGDAG